MPNALAREVRTFGIDAETTQESGLQGAPDRAHLSHAMTHGLVIVTEDADFASLHHHVPEHHGIVFFPGGRRRSIGEMVEALRLIHAVFTAEEMVGRLEYL